MRKFFKIVACSLAAIVVVLLLLGGAAYWATQQEPEFYEKAMEMDPVTQKEAGDELERKVLDLRNSLRHEERWESVFTENQINGWLAEFLPKKFPNTLPATIEDPRVSLTMGEARVACRYKGERFSSVVWLGAEIHLTEERNEVAIRILKARAGSLPIPLSKFLDQITEGARKAGVPLRWSQMHGDPVAILRLRVWQKGNMKRRLQIDTVEVRDGQVYLSGEVKGLDTSSGASGVLQTATVLSFEKITIQR